ncbi:MAG: hypothetical protein A2760_04015 [Candidatus Doudnabacteria bacterium RIFCSPHIGHO2_01_FULL_50_67]|nr:MAG: hypothetical protein A2760_04015 [Candidatus Doudnabacteria bacterium RIFCSPHIGHO2_01_FULL_50_67]OGF03726.1 MAG: hypothetical protein A3H14_02010 [Candidatus Doudnabacteria bacterium RIFCSPLOWO2_12_FULL_49_8]
MDLLAQAGHDVKVSSLDRPLSKDELKLETAGFDAILSQLVDKIDAEVLDAVGSQLKMDEFVGPHIEATGAGDAFGTAFTAAIFYGKNVGEAMAWGTINGGNVVMHIGPHAGLQTRPQIEKYLKTHPKFRAREI